MKTTRVPIIATAVAIVAATTAIAEPERMAEVQIASPRVLLEAAARLDRTCGGQSISNFMVMALHMVPDLAEYSGNVRMVFAAEPSQIDKAVAQGGKGLFEAFAASNEPAAPLAVGQIVSVMLEEKFLAMASKMHPNDTILNSARRMKLEADLTSAGLDLSVAVDLTPGAALDIAQYKPLDPSALDFAGRDAVFAGAYAPGFCGPYDKQFEGVVGVFRKFGLNTDFISFAKEGSSFKVTLDGKEMTKYLMSGFFEDIGRIKDADAFSGEIEKVLNACAKSTSTLQAFAFYLKGVRKSATASERFLRTMPGVDSRKCFDMLVFSPYSAIRELVMAQVDSQAQSENMKIAREIMARCPPDDDADIAMTSWKDGKLLHILVRVNPAEVKGIVNLLQSLPRLLPPPQNTAPPKAKH